MICPYCKTEVKEGIDTCPECGLDLSEYCNRDNVCPVCGADLHRWDTRCNTCYTERENMGKINALSHLSVEDRKTLAMFDFDVKNGGVTLRKLNRIGRYKRTIVLPPNVVAIGESAFEDADAEYETVILNEGLKEIGAKAFFKSRSLKEIVIPDSVRTIGNEAFSGVFFLKKAVIGKNVTKIGDTAFGFCGHLAEVTMGENVRTIGDHAFLCCDALDRITLGDKVEEIGGFAFGRCGFKSVYIPKNVKTMGSSAFGQCRSLSRIECGVKSRPAGWDENWMGMDSSATIQWGR